MAKELVTLPTTPSWSSVALGTTPAFASVSLPSIEWYISGGWQDATTYTWDNETRKWEQMGMLGNVVYIKRTSRFYCIF